jgi:hypothetical protein
MPRCIDKSSLDIADMTYATLADAIYQKTGKTLSAQQVQESAFDQDIDLP